MEGWMKNCGNCLYCDQLSDVNFMFEVREEKARYCVRHWEFVANSFPACRDWHDAKHRLKIQDYVLPIDDDTIEQMRGPFATNPRYDGLTEFPGLAETVVD